jgi:hypothetical protein
VKKHWLLLLLVFLIASSARPAEAAKDLNTADNATLVFKGGVITLDEPKIEIAKIYGIKLSASKSPMKMDDKELYVNHVIENLSNTSVKVSLHTVPLLMPRGWECKLVVDENMNGEHDVWETKEVPETLDMGEGAIYSFFAVFKRPADAAYGSSSSVIIRASCAMKSGNEYIGYNGVTYGGADEQSSLDTVVVE